MGHILPEFMQPLIDPAFMDDIMDDFILTKPLCVPILRQPKKEAVLLCNFLFRDIQHFRTEDGNAPLLCGQ
jgi:hypothetical protein